MTATATAKTGVNFDMTGIDIDAYQPDDFYTKKFNDLSKKIKVTFYKRKMCYIVDKTGEYIQYDKLSEFAASREITVNKAMLMSMDYQVKLARSLGLRIDAYETVQVINDVFKNVTLYSPIMMPAKMPYNRIAEIEYKGKKVFAGMDSKYDPNNTFDDIYRICTEIIYHSVPFADNSETVNDKANTVPKPAKSNKRKSLRKVFSV